MAEELNKYKQILGREDKEFRKVMEVDRLVLLSLLNITEKGRTPMRHILSPILQ